MIEVKVSYHGPFLDITRKREERVRLERSRARDLIEQLAGCYGGRFRDLLIDAQTGEEKRSTLLVAGGRRLELDTELQGGEEVSFLTSIAGGAFRTKPEDGLLPRLQPTHRRAFLAPPRCPWR